MNVDRLPELELTVTDLETTRRERETSSDFTRVTTEITLVGPGDDGTRRAGRGEDVIYDVEPHDALAERGLPDLSGEYTLSSFADRLETLELFPDGVPDRDAFTHYRRWALEAAALDLALRQAETSLPALLERDAEPVRFVTSTRLGEPPTTDRLEQLRSQVPGVDYKLEPTPEWDDGVVTAIQEAVGADAIRILDLKGQYEGTDVDVPADPDLYERVIEAFPDAIIEDPALTPETEPLFDDPAVRSRVSWDAPIHGLADVEALPWEPDWLNIKPSRFGSLESLLETLDYCEEHEIRLYGGGQFELGVGRGQLQVLAALCYPDGPNDIAPQAYNDPEVGDGLPTSPLEPPAESVGFRWE